MEELILNVKQNPGVIELNFDEIEAALDKKLEEYKGAVFTEESKTFAKKEVANLRKFKAKFEDARKSVKREWMKPYDDFEKRMKQLTAKIDEPINLINSQIAEFEQKRKAERQEEIRKIYQELIGDMAEYCELGRIYDPKWENATTTLKSIRESISSSVESTRTAVAKISGMQSEAVEKALKNSSGLILYPGGRRDDLPLIEKLDAEKTPLVLFDLYFNSSPVCCVVEDNFYGGYKATEALILAGRRRIGLITPHFGESSMVERYAGYRAALQRHGFPDEKPLFLDLQGKFDTEMLRFYFEKQKPDAVFVLSHMTALQVRHFLIQNGVRVPADVQFAKFDAFQGEEFTKRDITTVVQPEEEMGRQSVRLLKERISEPEAPKRKIFIVPEICIH